MQPPSIRLAELIGRYDALLFDAFGVLVHERCAVPGAKELLSRLHAADKPYFVVSNTSAKLPQSLAEHFAGFGLDVRPEQLITSGSLLVNHFATHGLVGARCALLGAEDTTTYITQAGGRLEPLTEDCEPDVLVIGDSVSHGFLRVFNAALTVVFRALDAARPLHLVMPNPDFIYSRGPQSFAVTAGSFALVLENAVRERYGDVALDIARLGKPYAAIFDEAVRRAGTRNLVMLGDQLATDIRGANDYGIDSVLVETGVQAPRTATHFSAADPAFWPTYRITSWAEALAD